MSIYNYLSEETKEAILTQGLSKQEKLAVAFFDLNEHHPNKKFRCSEVAPLVGMDAQFSRGITSMVKAIEKQVPNFPAHILLVNKKQGKLDVKKLQKFIPNLQTEVPVETEENQEETLKENPEETL